MNREIKFRGKRIDTGEWVYGLLMANFDNKYSIQVRCDFDDIKYFISHKVIPETIGEFTGLKDKNGKEIYEDDIVEWEDTIDYEMYGGDNIQIKEGVRFEGGCFYPICMMSEEEYEIIDNICENPELIN